MKKLLLALVFVASPVMAQTAPKPPDMYDLKVPFLLHCVKSFGRMVEILAEDFGEAPIALSHMSPTSTLVIFTNEDRTQSTVVITKRDKTREESCMAWSGSSDGMSFSINPNPEFPKPKAKIEGVGT